MNTALLRANAGRFIALTIASLVAIISLPSMASAHSMRDHKKQRQDIVATAIAINKSNGEFSTLIAAASCTHIAQKLSGDHAKYTLFAPTDAAFAKLNLNASNVCSTLDTKTLTNILEYHITYGKKPAERVLARKKLTMLNHKKAPIVGATIAGQNIVQTDVFASNGVIHVIDGVMIP